MISWDFFSSNTLTLSSFSNRSPPDTRFVTMKICRRVSKTCFNDRILGCRNIRSTAISVCRACCSFSSILTFSIIFMAYLTFDRLCSAQMTEENRPTPSSSNLSYSSHGAPEIACSRTALIHLSRSSILSAYNILLFRGSSAKMISKPYFIFALSRSLTASTKHPGRKVLHATSTSFGLWNSCRNPFRITNHLCTSWRKRCPILFRYPSWYVAAVPLERLRSRLMPQTMQYRIVSASIGSPVVMSYDTSMFALHLVHESCSGVGLPVPFCFFTSGCGLPDRFFLLFKICLIFAYSDATTDVSVIPQNTPSTTSRISGCRLSQHTNDSLSRCFSRPLASSLLKASFSRASACSSVIIISSSSLKIAREFGDRIRMAAIEYSIMVRSS
mmetsp:Transcript_14460/g.29128  ORF Transcript_14460/g.29128 Transcript_14460/m.29128 type:complete len:386 (-) Transcript_14460:368-1525(-)